MFGSTLLDVAVGMIFVFLLVSLLSSAAIELIEAWLKKRATCLEWAIRGLLSPGSGVKKDDLVAKVYDHPLIRGLYRGTYSDYVKAERPPTWWRRLVALFRKGPSLPSYIPARNFALALMDTAVESNDLVTEPARRALLALMDAAGDDVAKARDNIEDWFNTAMDRMSGRFKRRAQVLIMIVGFLLAVALNIDSIVIAKRLSTDKPLRDALVAAAQVRAHTATPPANSASTTSTPSAGAKSSFDESLDEIKKLGLPIGWDHEDPQIAPCLLGTTASPEDWRRKLLGWLITALAASFGAPFWFDMLNKFIVVRSTFKPREEDAK